ncbi:MAG: hypothetical protein OdinLCB4_001430 [Candidatus Odinarchaeum yellowstonii]|uniref:Uncharacterized protein n=1 Tax=Odinarchaeota yellowstonii (strain LCB_4) TaxID=1841599 RepID=A0AAF0D2T0_ODILC|nr:MAG: hypothetical protein OdinLCB4_001430 [Candidatus Odinarchaeum yellowstonii]
MVNESERIKRKAEKDSKRTFIEKIIRYIPIYNGYKTKEIRRETDKILRENIYMKLKGALDKLKDVKDRVVEANLQELWPLFQKLIYNFETITQRVLYSDYGYSGFFSVIKINEPELERMYNFDSSLLDDAVVIGEVVKELCDASYDLNASKIKSMIKRVEDAVSQFEEKFAKREEYMNGFIE